MLVSRSQPFLTFLQSVIADGTGSSPSGPLVPPSPAQGGLDRLRILIPTMEAPACTAGLAPIRTRNVHTARTSGAAAVRPTRSRAHTKMHTRRLEVVEWVHCRVPALNTIKFGIPATTVREAQVFELDGMLTIGGWRKALS